MSRFDVKDYVSKQLKFSGGNLLSVPVGIAVLYFLTSIVGVWYLWSSLLTLIVTTVMNFWVQVLLRTIKLKSQEQSE